jgi:hypothetical protein
MAENVVRMPEPDPVQEYWERQNRENFRSFLRHNGIACGPTPVLPFPARSGQLRLPFERIVFEIRQT